MGDFFHGWRRKTGFVALLIALGFTALWMRSLTTIDTVRYFTKVNSYNWISRNGTIEYADYVHGPNIPLVQSGRYFWQRRQITQEDISAYSHRPVERWGVFYTLQQKPSKYVAFHIEYNSIVISLTVLSGVLLFSKQRKPKAIQSPNGTALCQPRLSAWEHGPSP